MPISVEYIAGNDELAEAIAELSEVELRPGDTSAPMCSVQGVNDLDVFAQDGGGGQFAVSRSSGLVFYFSSEGAAGVVGKDFETFITIVVAMPFWRDVLKYSKNGNLDEMRRAAEALEDDWAEDEDVAASRGDLLEWLKLNEDADVVADLHTAVRTSGPIADAWGNPSETLFGGFTIDDNPMLRPSTAP